MNLGWIAYMGLCVLWGIFAMRMQVKLVYDKRWYNNLVIVGFINALIAPLAMIVAIIRCPTEKRSSTPDLSSVYGGVCGDIE